MKAAVVVKVYISMSMAFSHDLWHAVAKAELNGGCRFVAPVKSICDI